MQKLHLVGFTTDEKGLILSARRGARSGSFHLPLDDALAEAVEELRARQAEEAAGLGEDTETTRAPRVESLLPVREIQARLRQGRSVQDVARAAGVEPAWVERFAVPVYAEQAQVIRRVLGSSLRRVRLGPSSHAVSDAVRRNLAERGLAMTPEEFTEAWSTRQLADGRWAVRFRYRYRGKDQVLRFDLDDVTGEVVAADRVSGQLGYVAPPPRAAPPAVRPRPAAPKAADDARPSAKRATVTTGFRPDPAAKAVSRPAKERERASAAMRKAATQRALEGERAATRKAKERAREAAQLERAERVAEARRVREAAAAERATAVAARKKAAAAERSAAERARKKEAAAKKAAAERARKSAQKQAAGQARRAEAALRAAEKAKAAEQKPVKAPASRTRAANKPPAKRPTAKVPAAKAAPVAPKAPAPRAPAKRAPVAKPPPIGPSPVKQPPTPTPAAASTPVPARRGPLPVVLRDELPGVTPVGRVADDAPPSRPTFRPGLVEVTAPPQGEVPEVAAASPANGVAPPRPLDRPRRTRPLRAT